MREEQAHHCRLAQILSLQSPQRAASEISLFPLCICSLSAELSCSFSPQDGTRKRTSSLFQKGCFFFFFHLKSLYCNSLTVNIILLKFTFGEAGGSINDQ